MTKPRCRCGHTRHAHEAGNAGSCAHDFCACSEYRPEVEGEDSRRIHAGFVWLQKDGHDGIWCSLECYLTDGARHGQEKADVIARTWHSPSNPIAVIAVKRLCCDACGLNLHDLWACA